MPRKKTNLPAYLKRDKKLQEKIRKQKPLMKGKFQHEMSEATRKKLEAHGLIKPLGESRHEAFIKSANILSQLSRYG